YHSDTDISLPGIGLPFVFSRTYNSLDSLSPSGQGWTMSYHDALTVNGDGSVWFRADDGQQLLFVPQGGGFIPVDAGVLATLTATSGGYTVVRPDQERDTFDGAGRLLTKQDENGNTLTFTRDVNGLLSSITDTAGRVLTVTVDDQDGLG